MNLLPFIGKKKGGQYTQIIILVVAFGVIGFLIWYFFIRNPKPVTNPGYGGTGTPGASSPILIDTVRTANDQLFNVINGFFSSADAKNEAASLAYGFSNAQIIALADDWAARYAPTVGAGLYQSMENEWNVPYLTAGANYWEILKERLKTANATY